MSRLTITLLVILQSMLCFSQTGPGGVGNNSNNILWLRADNLNLANGAAVAAWDDASGNSNDASQGTAGNRPVYVLSNADFNGKPTVTFDGSNHNMQLDLTNAESNYSIFIVYNSTSTTNRQFLFDSQTGTLILPHRGRNNERAYHDGTARGDENTNAFTQIVNWHLDNSGASVFVNGEETQSGLDYTQRAIGGTTRIGSNNAGNNRRLNGNMAEAVFFNTLLNSAQRIIIENYLGAKYGLTIENDFYSYKATHHHDVAGIGRVDVSNQHTSARSARILQVSSPSSLGDGDYLLFGHDDAAIVSWTSDDTPDDFTQRVAREWRMGMTGSVGTVTMSIDTALLPSKPAGFTQYCLLVSSDGDFENNATRYPLTLNSGLYEATGLSITNGDYVTIGMFTPLAGFTVTSASGAESVSPVTVGIEINQAMTHDVTVDYEVTGGTATGGGVDFTLANGTATITAGNTSTSFDIIIIDDELEEDDETIIITLRNPSNGIVLNADTVYTYTILDNDNARKIEFSTTAASGLESVSPVIVTIRTNQVDITDTISVDYTVTGGTATSGGVDYTLANGTAKIPPGDTTTTFSITIINDALNEHDETIIISLTNASENANVGDSNTFTYTILDNDTLPQAGFVLTASSGLESVANPVITVQLSTVSGRDVTVTCNATGGSAIPNTDFTISNTTVTIPEGELSANIELTIIDNQEIQVNRTIMFTLSSTTHATLTSNIVHTYTIIDDDNLGSTGPGGVGDAASNILWLKADALNLANGSAIATWTDASGNDHDATQGTAAQRPIFTLANADFNDMPTVTFDGSDDNMILSMTQDAGNYQFFVVYKSTSTTNRQYLFDTQTGTLILPHRGQNNERAYHDGTARGDQNTSATTQIVGWQLDNTGSSVFINGLETQSDLTYVQRAIGGNTRIGSNNAGGNRRFNGNIAEMIFFNKTLNTAQRKIIENYLGAKYGLAIDTSLYSYGSTHYYEIGGIGSDGLPNVHSAAKAGILGIENPSSLNTNDYLLFGHNGASAAAWSTDDTPDDFTQRIAREWRMSMTGNVGTITINVDTTLLSAKPAGFTQYCLLVSSDGDFENNATRYPLSLNNSSYEADEINIAHGNYVTVGVFKPLVAFSATSASGLESVSPVTVTIDLEMEMSHDVSVDYEVTGGTATGGGVDYTLANGTATITAGNTSTSFEIIIIDDDLEEPDETIIITLRNPSSGIDIDADSVFTYTIFDNDSPRKIEFQTTSASGDESVSPVIVTIRINEVDISDTTSVNYSVTGGTATGGGVDYTLANGTAKISPGDTTTTFSIIIINDALNEADETIIISLSNASANANIGDNNVFTYTILDNDPMPQVGFELAVSSGSESQANPVINIELSAASGRNVTVYCNVTGGTGVQGVDYTYGTVIRTIPAGQTIATVELTVLDNQIIEPNRTVRFTLSNPTHASLTTDTVHIYTILDDDNLGSTGPGGVGDALSNILWLKADDLTLNNGDPVATWHDASGNGHNATQGTAAQRPVFLNSNTNLNNMPSVTFDGGDDNLIFSFTNDVSNYNMFVVYHNTNVTNRQYLFDTETGRITLPHRGGTNEGAFHDGAVRGAEITGTTPRIVGWQLDNTGSSIFINGVETQSGLDYTQRAIGGNTRLGSNNNGGNRRFNGNIAEVIFYNKTLNSVQRKMVENYLSAKYGIAVEEEIYIYNATHGNEVAGIGSEGASDVHTAAASGIITVSNSGGLGTGEYLTFGHDGASVAAWQTDNVPNVEVQRIEREWRFDMTGDVGTITISVDTTTLPAKNGNYQGLVVLVSSDGDFETNVSYYPFEHVEDDIFRAELVTIPDGAYVTIGAARFLNKYTGNFSDTTNWYAGVVPGSLQSPIVMTNTTLTLDADATVGSITVSSGATLNLGTRTLTIDEGTITNYGTINTQSGTIHYAANGSQTVAGMGYYHLSMSGSGDKTLNNHSVITGNLNIQAGTLDVSASNYDITLSGNWNNTGGAFNPRNGRVIFNGTTQQTITSNERNFYNLTINKPSSQITLSGNLILENELVLTQGIITTGNDTVMITNPSGNALTTFGSASFINGQMVRYIDVNEDTYSFPIGNGTAATNYFLAEIDNDSLEDVTYLYTRFRPLDNHDDSELAVFDTTLVYNSIADEGVWVLEPDQQPTGGAYNIKLFIANISDLEDNLFAVLKRPVNSTSGADWSTGNGQLNPKDGEGRLLADGYALRNNLTDFSEFGAGRGDENGFGLPIELLSFSAIPDEEKVRLEWITATEINNHFFTVERSQNGLDFEPLSVFEGAGNSSETNYYSTVDRRPFKGTSYYRLKQTDFDGTFTFSRIVSVFLDIMNPNFYIVPNPVTDGEFKLHFSNTPAASLNGNVSIYDMTGKMTFRQDISTGDEISNYFKLPENMNGGFYVIKILLEDGTMLNQKLMVN